MKRTTFFTAEIEGPMQPERFRYVASHRNGCWSLKNIKAICAKSGVSFIDAYSISRDSKGFIQSSRREVTV